MLDPIYVAVSAVMWGWHQLFGLLLGPASGAAWALSVVFLVLSVRAALIRPFLAQVRSARVLRALAPQLAELRRRHAGDTAGLAAATAALQKEHGVSTLRSILPALVQIPVFLGLLHVLHSFDRPALTAAENAALPNYTFGADDVRSFLAARLLGAPLSSWLSMPQHLLDAVGAQRPAVALVVVPLVLLAALATHLSARHSLVRQPQAAGAAAPVARWLPWLLPLGVLVGGLVFPFPVAILLYWLTQSVWTLAQQRIVLRDGGAAPP